MSTEKNNLWGILIAVIVISITIFIFVKFYNNRSTVDLTKSAINTSMTNMQLENTNWSLVRYSNSANNGSMVDLPSDVKVTLLMKESAVSGNSGCNNYFGSYTTDGYKIHFSQMGSTEMYCGEVAGAVESAYLGNLSKVVSYKLNESNLTFFDKDGKEILFYNQMETLGIEGTNWNALMINNGKDAIESVPAGVTVTAKFENGAVSGNAGCNSYNGTYVMDGDKIKFGEIATTFMFCEDPAMTVETNYLTSLKNTDNYVFENEMLVLRQGDTRQVEYKAE